MNVGINWTACVWLDFWLFCGAATLDSLFRETATNLHLALNLRRLALVLEEDENTGGVSGRSRRPALWAVDIAKQRRVESGASDISRAGRCCRQVICMLRGLETNGRVTPWRRLRLPL